MWQYPKTSSGKKLASFHNQDKTFLMLRRIITYTESHWDSHNHLTKAVRFDSGINNGSPLGNILLYVELQTYVFFSGFKYIICLPDSY